MQIKIHFGHKDERKYFFWDIYTHSISLSLLSLILCVSRSLNADTSCGKRRIWTISYLDSHREQTSHTDAHRYSRFEWTDTNDTHSAATEIYNIQVFERPYSDILRLVTNYFVIFNREASMSLSKVWYWDRSMQRNHLIKKRPMQKKIQWRLCNVHYAWWTEELELRLDLWQELFRSSVSFWTKTVQIQKFNGFHTERSTYMCPQFHRFLNDYSTKNNCRNSR